jgi:hypothetical protein
MRFFFAREHVFTVFVPLRATESRQNNGCLQSRDLLRTLVYNSYIFTLPVQSASNNGDSELFNNIYIFIIYDFKFQVLESCVEF